jgi:transposase-like protein
VNPENETVCKAQKQIVYGEKLKQKKYSNDLKTKIALMALKPKKTGSEIASEFGIHANSADR